MGICHPMREIPGSYYNVKKALVAVGYYYNHISGMLREYSMNDIARSGIGVGLKLFGLSQIRCIPLLVSVSDLSRLIRADI